MCRLHSLGLDFHEFVNLRALVVISLAVSNDADVALTDKDLCKVGTVCKLDGGHLLGFVSAELKVESGLVHRVRFRCTRAAIELLDSLLLLWLTVVDSHAYVLADGTLPEVLLCLCSQSRQFGVGRSVGAS